MAKIFSATPLSKLRQSVGKTVRLHLDGYDSRLQFARLDDKLIRDPIFGFQRLRPYEMLIVDSPLFQRLRGIFQTSVTYLTYPSSIHTRFEHSLNCLKLAARVLSALEDKEGDIDEVPKAEVRLAALLHDIGHCIFSHGSEFFYRGFAEFERILSLDEPQLASYSPSASECVNYCIVTSDEFKKYLWDPIKERCRTDERCRKHFNFIDDINLEHVAEMIIGAPPGDSPERRYQAEIINGPLDVDKLDYLTRDGYFSGVTLTVDIDRLLPSLRLARVQEDQRNRKEKRLVVDHRGISVVEQLLFARMLLYDTVYHHHKVRAANATLQTIFKNFHNKPVWPTSSRYLKTMRDFLEIDEYDFFGFRSKNKALRSKIQALRCRCLPERALVLTTRALVNERGYTTWSTKCSDFTNREDSRATEKSGTFVKKLKQRIVKHARAAGARDITSDDVAIDIPDPPKYTRLGEETRIQMVQDYVVPLNDFFPFHKIVNNYSTQYKYRSYVFSNEKFTPWVAYAAFRAFAEEGIFLNDLALILAHQQVGKAQELLQKNNVEIPDWRTKFYSP